MDTLMDFIMKTYQSSKRYRAEKLDCGLVPFHQLYIYRICRHPGGSQDWLARALCISKSNVTRQLTTLEQAGFVTRSPDPDDRRIMRVYPTEKAEEVFPQVEKLIREWETLLLDQFTEEEKSVFLNLMKRAASRAAELAGEESGAKKKE